MFSGRKFGGQNLRKDDAEAPDGASGLWPGPQEERDGKHVEEPREDPRLGEERRDVVRLVQKKTNHLQRAGDCTEPRKNIVIFKKNLHLWGSNLSRDATHQIFVG